MKRLVRGQWPAMLSAVGAGIAVALMVLAAPRGSEFAVPPGWLLGGTAVLAALFATAIAVIAWRAAEWSPAFLALGCIWMGQAAIIRGLQSVGLLPDSAGALEAVNAVGMLAGGVWFAVGARPRWPAGSGNATDVRLLLAGGAFLGAVATAAAALAPGPWTGEVSVAVLSASAVAGYLLAAFAFAAAFRFLRLPSQFSMAAGTAALAAVTVVSAQPLVHLSTTTIELLVVCASALPPIGFVLEQRARPGLRTMVLSLFVSGAVEHLQRGHPQPVLELLEEVAGYDEGLAGHLDRVAKLAVRVGQALGMGPAELRTVAQAAQLHDVGKIVIPRHVLDSTGKLSGDDWELMKSHAAEGERIVARIAPAVRASRSVGEHHERWDGSGYPRGLSGEAISLAGRVVAVADVYDALCSSRSYKAAWSPSDALAEIRRGSGTHFDPAVVDALEQVVTPEAAHLAAA
ncbi:MAG: HD-GYP domain-containing protein [Dehalococcoidia bacterium]